MKNIKKIGTLFCVIYSLITIPIAGFIIWPRSEATMASARLEVTSEFLLRAAISVVEAANKLQSKEEKIDLVDLGRKIEQLNSALPQRTDFTIKQLDSGRWVVEWDEQAN